MSVMRTGALASAFAAESPPKPPPTITTWGMSLAVATVDTLADRSATDDKGPRRSVGLHTARLNSTLSMRMKPDFAVSRHLGPDVSRHGADNQRDETRERDGPGDISCCLGLRLRQVFAALRAAEGGRRHCSYGSTGGGDEARPHHDDDGCDRPSGQAVEAWTSVHSAGHPTRYPAADKRGYDSGDGPPREGHPAAFCCVRIDCAGIGCKQPQAE